MQRSTLDTQSKHRKIKPKIKDHLVGGAREGLYLQISKASRKKIPSGSRKKIPSGLPRVSLDPARGLKQNS